MRGRPGLVCAWGAERRAQPWVSPPHSIPPTPTPRGWCCSWDEAWPPPVPTRLEQNPALGWCPPVLTPYGAGIWYELSKRLELGGEEGALALPAPRPHRQLTPRCLQPRAASFVWWWWEGEDHPQGSPRSAPAESRCSPGWEAGLGGWGGAHRGPPGAHSLLSTGCCRHISLPAEMMGR